MEKKELSRREILERLWVTSDELYLVATSKREHLLRKPIGADLINIGSLKAEIKQELDKAREEGRKEVINELNDLDDVENNDEFGQYKVWAKYLIEQLSKLNNK